MNAEHRSLTATISVAVAASAIAAVSRYLLNTWLALDVRFVTFFAAVMAGAWYGGVRGGLIATVLSAALSQYLFIPPAGSFRVESPAGALKLVLFVSMGAIATGFAEAMHAARRDLARRQQELLKEMERRHAAERSEGAQREQLHMTLQSIADGVMVTDQAGIITEMNPVAESLTGWSTSEAVGRSHEAVFVIVDESTREGAPSPVARALAQGAIAGLANHTLLLSRDGRASAIEESAAPIRDRNDDVTGCVLVFRDVTERRQAEQPVRESERELTDFFDKKISACTGWDRQASSFEPIVRSYACWATSRASTSGAVSRTFMWMKTSSHPSCSASRRGSPFRTSGHACGRETAASGTCSSGPRP